MAGTSKAAAARTTELHMPHRRWKDGREETSPERTKIWTEPPNSNSKHKFPDRRVPVIYYICRNGQLEHPHFMEVPLSSPEGLYLKDVINRLNFLRGKGMASLYSWSSKRSYKNGYVWHDLSENDFIFPAHGQEYILKGSEILEGGPLMSKSDETVTYSSEKLPATDTRRGDQEFPPVKAHRRRNQSWSSFDLHEYKVYTGESVWRAAADASTQTDDKHRRRRAIREIEEVEDETGEKCKGVANSQCQSNNSSEIIISSTDEISEISPPPSDSSPETLETLMKADGRIILRPETADDDRTANNNSSSSHSSGAGRIKAASVLMQLLSCGSIGFKNCGPGQGRENGFSLISHYKVRLPRGGGGNNQMGKDPSESERSTRVGSSSSGFGGGRRVIVEEKEYFSGSLVETKKNEFQFPALKRSSSYNADRSSQMEVVEVEEINEGSRAKCIPRKPKTSITLSTKIERSTSDISCSSKG